MSPKKKKTEKRMKNHSCVCGHGCHDKHSHLPGYLLMAFGLLALPVQFDLIPSLEWAKAWPLLLVVLGVVFAIKTTLCKTQGKVEKK